MCNFIQKHVQMKHVFLEIYERGISNILREYSQILLSEIKERGVNEIVEEQTPHFFEPGGEPWCACFKFLDMQTGMKYHCDFYLRSVAESPYVAIGPSCMLEGNFDIDNDKIYVGSDIAAALDCIVSVIQEWRDKKQMTLQGGKVLRDV